MNRNSTAVYKKQGKILIVCTLLLMLGGVFGFAQNANAQTVGDLQAQIQALLAQVQQLQMQLAQLQGTETTAWCHTFDTNITIGDSGWEVEALQNALYKEGFGVGRQSQDFFGKFGSFTVSDVIAFQEKYKEEILTPLRLERGTGLVGSATRAKLNKLYGCPYPVPKVSITALSPSSGPVDIAVMIYGTGFTATGNTVNFRGRSLENLPSPSSKTLSFKIPRGTYVFCGGPGGNQCLMPEVPGDATISVRNSNGVSNTIIFKITPGP